MEDEIKSLKATQQNLIYLVIGLMAKSGLTKDKVTTIIKEMLSANANAVQDILKGTDVIDDNTISRVWEMREDWPDTPGIPVADGSAPKKRRKKNGFDPQPTSPPCEGDSRL
jgi:hypothetical protein